MRNRDTWIFGVVALASLWLVLLVGIIIGRNTQAVHCMQAEVARG